MRVIIVEDELIAAEFLKEIIEESGAEVIDVIDTGKEAISVCIREKPDVIFMDVMLADNISGADAAVAINRQSPQSKIIFLTAYVDDDIIDYAAEAHAVGYLTKPYNKMQILATLKLVMQSNEENRTTPLVEMEERKPEKIHLKNGYVYLRQKKRLLKEGKEVELGPTAIKLIELLCSQPGISVSNEQIAMHVWGKEVNDRTLRSLMFRIRSATDNELIKNVSGTGYLIQPV
jgi:DNA-binding response OmpR family regulator